MHRASKKEFSTIYLFEKQGTTEDSEWFQINFKWPRGLIYRINVESIRTFNDPLFLKQILVEDSILEAW